jgi:DNA repair protein RecN (Recombination protein N)
MDSLCAAAAAGVQALAPDSVEDRGALALLAGAASQLDGIAGVDARLDALATRMSCLVVESQDLASELRDYAENLAGDDGSLEDVEGRLAASERLIRKHGGSIGAVVDHAARARARRDQLAGAEVARRHTTERLADARAELDRHVQALRRARKRAAPQLARAVREQLAALAMAGADFEVSLSSCAPGPDGGDRVELLIAPNPGVPAGPLREIASGGELSRAMLAVIAASNGAEAAANARTTAAQATVVFDEIDAGIGGHAARAVGERLRRLGESRQLLCITHLPQIASLGARHFSVVKDTSVDPTLARVVQLDEPEVLSELVRMLGADDRDAAARRHARDLRRAA